MSRKSIKIGPIESLVLFGGGPLVLEFAKEVLKRDVQPTVFAVKRHLEEIVDDDNQYTLKEALEKASIPCFHSRDINDSPELRSVISDKTMGIGLGEAYTFNKETIDLFRGRLFDFMVIRLPQYRGGAHFTWQILREDRVGCWNIQVINEAMVPGVFDSGELIKTHVYKLPESASIPADYFESAHEEGIKLFKEFINEVQAGKEFDLVRLKDDQSSYFPRLYTMKQAFINWSWAQDEIKRFICAFDDPYRGASTFIEGQRVSLKNCQIDSSGFQSHPFMSGLVYRITGQSVFISTKSGAIVVQSVLDAKGNDMVSTLKIGQRFYTPGNYLEDAMCYRAEYNSEGLVQHD